MCSDLISTKICRFFLLGNPVASFQRMCYDVKRDKFTLIVACLLIKLVWLMVQNAWKHVLLCSGICLCFKFYLPRRFMNGDLTLISRYPFHFILI